jgi:hypothetical protein
VVYEHHKSPLLPRQAFFRRLAAHFFLSLGVLGVALGIGMAGYHFLEEIPWVDAFANAAMILSGMGPLMTLHTTEVFITATGIILVPLGHRLLHKFHLQNPEKP